LWDGIVGFPELSNPTNETSNPAKLLP